MKTHLGHYEIVDELGRGGMGVVYKGFEPALGRFVAIKELSPSLAHDANLVERFLREARSMAALNDPHIIQIYFIGTDEATGQPFFAMEFVDGDSLSGLLKRDGRLTVENALKVLHQTALGLATAHDKGVIHRDIKPANLMVTERGNVKIADFGIALATQDFSKKLTSTGEFVGTPGYLSPEVCTGKTVDRRSDIFSLGIVLFEMLSGSSPFTDESPLGLMLEVVKADIPDIRALNTDVDAETAAILTRMLAKDPADRFPGCHELAAALEAHPLVAKGGTIKLALPKADANQATVVGAPTPGAQPLRQATPPPVIGRGGTAPSAPMPLPPAAPMAVGSTNRESVAPARPRSSHGARWVMAAAVLLLVGAVWALGGPMLQGWRQSGDPAAPTATANAPAASGSESPASTPPPVNTPAPSIDGAHASDEALPDAAGDVSATFIAAAEPARQAADGDGVVGMAASTPAVPPIDAASAEVEQRDSAPLAPAAEAAFVASPEQPRPRLAAAKALRDNRQTVASIAPPVRQAAAPAALPRIAVVAFGDAALTSPVRQRIEERLSAAGFELVEAELFIDGRGELASVLADLRREATVAVVIRTESLGQRQLQYAGRSDTQYSANLSVRAYLVDERRPLGPGFTEKVDFTTLNASDNAGIAIRGHLDKVVGELSPYRRRG